MAISGQFVLPQGFQAWAFLTLVAVALLYVTNSYLAIPSPKGVHFIREAAGARSFSLRTRLSYYTDFVSILSEAYEQYAKKGKAVMIPGVGLRSELVLPNSSMRWVLSQPDDVLSSAEATADFMYIHHALGTGAPILDPWQGMLVKRDMNQVLEGIAVALDEELAVAFDAHFGTDANQWREVELVPTVRRIIGQAASRFTVGLPLCRDEGYLDTCLRCVDAFIMHPALSSFVPAVLQPALGWLSGLQVRRSVRVMKKFLGPLIQKRLGVLEGHEKGEEGDAGHEEPLDHLQMMLRFAQRERPHELHDLDMMTKRVAIANLGSFHQTAQQTTNILLNIMGSDSEFNTIAILRDEATHILEHNPSDSGQSSPQQGGWTRANVAKMTKADSVMRETLRMQSLGGRNVVRKVLVDGLVSDSGVALPRGSLVGFLGQPVHHDEDKYEDAGQFDPFRFSRIREREAVRDQNEGATAGTAGTAVKSGTSWAFVSTSPDFLPFGTGRHACPGRFLVDFELKMIISYVLAHYEVRFPDSYGGKRPPNQWIAEINIPPSDVKILVKRRAAG